jgi:dihydrofolate reductase
VTREELRVTSNPPGKRPRISLIVAMARNRVIGANGGLPWHLSSDLKRFKALTMGHHILMGRKTFESIGRVLPGRTSVVITRNPRWRAEGVVVASSLADALSKAAGDDEIFVIGGEQVFREALNIADRILLTEIGRDFDGDTHFPRIDGQEWVEVSREPVPDPELPATLRVLEKKHP